MVMRRLKRANVSAYILQHLKKLKALLSTHHTTSPVLQGPFKKRRCSVHTTYGFIVSVISPSHPHCFYTTRRPHPQPSPPTPQPQPPTAPTPPTPTRLPARRRRRRSSPGARRRTPPSVKGSKRSSQSSESDSQSSETTRTSLTNPVAHSASYLGDVTERQIQM